VPRGGARPGAGRPRGSRPVVLHQAREAIPAQFPVHVTFRVRKDVPSLRNPALLEEWKRSLADANDRGGIRVVHYRFQDEHVHLIVEANGKDALGRGMKSIGARLARAVNRVFRRSGPVLDSRYQHRVLRTPREVRRALAFVVLGARRRRDAVTSARWFDGWREGTRGEEAADDPREVAAPHTWLLRMGWRRHGLVDPAEAPTVPDTGGPLSETASRDA